MLGGEEIDLVRLLTDGTMVLVALLALQGIIGTRPVTELNAPQLLLLVALGITVGAVMIWDSIAALEGALAFAVLLTLLWIVGRTTQAAGSEAGWSPGKRLLIVRKGQVLPAAAEQAHVSPEEILEAVRRCGYASLDGIEVVTREPDGCFTVVDWAGHVATSSLGNVVRLPTARARKDG